jgi:hypothetical protein
MELRLQLISMSYLQQVGCDVQPKFCLGLKCTEGVAPFASPCAAWRSEEAKSKRGNGGRQKRATS